MQPSRLLMALLLAGGLSIGGTAAAAGFALQNQNGAGNGYAYAGAGAVAQDASTIYFNPAGMTYLAPGHHVSGAGNLLIRSLRFHDTGSGPFLNYPLGDNGGQAGGLAPVPSVYWSMSLGSAFRIGLGVSPTFGNATDWSKTFIGRFQGVESTITAINFNPSIAWKLHEDVSLGVGLNVVKFDADLRNIVPVTALLPVPVEVETKLKGDDVGFGYNVGLMFRLSPSTRVGLTYRSAVNLKVNGNLSAPGAVIPASVPIELPDTASLAISHMMNDRLRLLADLTWTGWSSVQAIVAKNRTSGATLGTNGWDSITPFGLVSGRNINIPSGCGFTPGSPGTRRLSPTPLTGLSVCRTLTVSGSLWVSIRSLASKHRSMSDMRMYSSQALTSIVRASPTPRSRLSAVHSTRTYTLFLSSSITTSNSPSHIEQLLC